MISPTCSTSTGRSARPSAWSRAAVASGQRRAGRRARPPAPREGIAAIRAAGARVRLIEHGDVSAALQAVTERTPVDLLWGVEGRPRASSRRPP